MSRTASKAQLQTTLCEIGGAPRPNLIDRWRAVHGAPPPKSLSLLFLRKSLAYEAQCAASGAPKGQVLRDLKRQTLNQGPTKAKPGLQPGAQLLREWNGHTYRVTVTDDGFDMAGQRWASLSAIARHITGAHWSGPRFFGIGAAKGKSRGARKVVT